MSPRCLLFILFSKKLDTRVQNIISELPLLKLSFFGDRFVQNSNLVELFKLCA